MEHLPIQHPQGGSEEKMETNIQFSDGFVMTADNYLKIKKGILEVLKNELPAEAQTVEIIGYALRGIVDDLSSVQIKL